jgi:hypothetical protein
MKILYNIKYTGFMFVYVTDESLDTTATSLTNGIETLIKNLSGKRGIINEDTALYYRDTDGRVDEVLHDGKKFIGFGFGFPNEEVFFNIWNIDISREPIRANEEAPIERD